MLKNKKIIFFYGGDVVLAASPEYKGAKVLSSESYESGKLEWETTYY
jgi:hypothetical protein